MSDPRFPDRPETQDFKRMSMVIVATDNRADLGESVDEIINEVVDMRSIVYMAEQRVLRLQRAHGIVPSPSLRAAYIALYVDAFTAGVRFQQAGGHR